MIDFLSGAAGDEPNKKTDLFIWDTVNHWSARIYEARVFSYLGAHPELRLIFSQGEKKQYTTDEIVALLDKIAMAKDQK